MLGKVLIHPGQGTELAVVLGGGGSAFAPPRDPKIANIPGNSKGKIIVVRKKKRNNTNVKHWKIAQHLTAQHIPKPPPARDPA